MKRVDIYLLISMCLAAFSGSAQKAPNKLQYIPPIKIPLSLAGNFGELRTNHFHSGLDFRTQGRTGLPIYAVADGYVSRVKISSTGYGKAIYLNHPNGETTVYGHLQKLNSRIDSLVKAHQYANEQFELDYPLPSGEIEFKQGDIIAWSGNSGSSGGPHLHFEIRNTESQRPQNGLNYGFKVKDTSPPKLYNLFLYPTNTESRILGTNSKHSFQIIKEGARYTVSSNESIQAFGKIGLGIQTTDFLDDSWNKCGAYSITVIVNQDTIYAFNLSDFSFNETRYINSHIDFAERQNNKRWVHRLYHLPGNKLDIYTTTKDKGKITVQPGAHYTVKIVVNDVAGNSSLLQFTITGVNQNTILKANDYIRPFAYEREHYFEADDIQFYLPPNALYDDTPFNYERGEKPDGCFAALHKIHDPAVPLHRSFRLRIKPDAIPDSLQAKALFVKIDDKTGKKQAAGGHYEDGKIIGYLRSFGNYSVAVDTVAPEIVARSIENGKKLLNNQRIRFRVTDDLSGIKAITGYLDGKWVIFDYDPKTATATHYFDRSRTTFGQMHHLEFTVTDHVQNSTTYRATFYK